MDQKPSPPMTGAPRFLQGIFGFVFGGIGLTVLIFLWSASGWDAPPLFFRIFGSFIAIAFVATGGTLLFTAFVSATGVETLAANAKSFGHQAAAAPGSYLCPQCGAALGKGTEVSPLGDVKCTFCGRWFNVHQRV